MTTPTILPRLSLAEHPTKVESLLASRTLPSRPVAARSEAPTLALARWLWAPLVFLALWHCIDDARFAAGFAHIVVEIAVTGVVIAGVLVIQRHLEERGQLLERFSHHLEQAGREADHWRGEARTYLDGLGEAIDRQFRDWQLTPSECDVGLLLLKGLSHKEIGSIRKTSEQTVRSQALTLYRKAGLRGRHDLAAYFLEDLLLPGQPDTDRIALAGSAEAVD